MTMNALDNTLADRSWQPFLQQALSRVNDEYLTQLTTSSDWLPGPHAIFNAFSLPLDKVQYVLFGESPYPRAESANGYAFWDAAVHQLWSPTGFDKKVNRATSLRNMLKMMLVADGRLQANLTTQEAIARIDKSDLITTNQELFNNFLKHGFLLLNATPVLQPHQPPKKDAKAWQPFIQTMLQSLLTERPSIQLILFGKIAGSIDPHIQHYANPKLYAEHPYNLSFINNAEVLAFFKKLKLLQR